MKKVKDFKNDLKESGPGLKGKATPEKKAAALKLNRESQKSKGSGNPFVAVTHIGGKRKNKGDRNERGSS